MSSPPPRPFPSYLAWIAPAVVLGLGGAPGGLPRLHAAGPDTGTPFAARSTAAGTTLFSTLTAAETGLDAPNPYDDPAMWGRRYREFSLGAIGSGVAIGDIDGDGRPEVFFATKTGPNRLFRNLGGFRFEDITTAAGVAGPSATEGGASAWKQGAAFADIDNDGDLDLYVCRFAAANLLYVNDGAGVFTEEAAARGLALVDASAQGAFCDYDRDGWIDVYVATNVLDAERRPNGQRDRLYRNDGDGTFTEVTEAAGLKGETQCHAATWWDFDEDGWPDLYVDNDFRDPDQLLRNNRDGTFTNVLSWVVPRTPHSSMGADLGDINNDGHVDLLIADMAATTREKDHRGMAPLRAGLPDNEGRPGAAAQQYMVNTLFLGTGTSRVLEAAHLVGLAATDWTWSVRFEDLDLDGRLDLHVTNGMVRELHSSDITDAMMRRENLAGRIAIMKATPVLSEANMAFRNLGNLRFENTSAAWGLDHMGFSTAAAFGDLDGDGDLDLVFANYDAPATVCRNDSTSGRGLILDLRGRASNRYGVGARVDLEFADGSSQTRTLIVARGYNATSEPIVHFGTGDATAVARTTVRWPSGHTQVIDGLPTGRRHVIHEPDTPPPALASAPTGPASALFADVTQATQLGLANRGGPLAPPPQARQPLLSRRLNRPGPFAVAADLDGDGAGEIAIGGVAGESGRMLTRSGSTYVSALSPIFIAPSAVADGPIVAFDPDGDGDTDLLITKAGVAVDAGSPDYQPRLFLNSGRAKFSAAPDGMLPALPISVGAAVAADFDRDGHADLFIGGRVEPGAYPQSPRSALLAWRDGRYVDVTPEVAPGLARAGMVTGAAWSDVDADGWPDLVLAREWGTIACWRNDAGRGFTDVSDKLGFAAAGTGWWRSLAAADLNADGRPDFVAGNLGLNTRYHASPEQPALLYAGVAVDGARPQLIEAHHADGRIYPLATREHLVRAFPTLGARIPTQEIFARTPLEGVFPAAALAAATRLEATQLQSGVFLSRPDGTWTFSPLAREAQIAPISTIVSGDFDADGHVDLVVAGNDFTPTAEVGRFDGGLGWLLRGDGRGGLAPVWPRESGLVFSGDVRALVATDLDGDGRADLVATRNNAPSLAFARRGGTLAPSP